MKNCHICRDYGCSGHYLSYGTLFDELAEEEIIKLQI